MDDMTQIPTFLSYSDKNKKLAEKLSDLLKPHGFEVFLAHCDIEISVEWSVKIKNEIYNSELFLVLLSEDFKKSEHTNHEVGIAIAHNKRIFSIMIDKIKPYGFMYGFQGKQINKKLVVGDIEDLAKKLKKFTLEGQKIINELIEKLATSDTFKDANSVARDLESHPSFTNDQIDRIAKIYLDNNQVRESWTAGPHSRDLLTKNWNRIYPDLRWKLGSKFVKTLEVLD